MPTVHHDFPLFHWDEPVAINTLKTGQTTAYNVSGRTSTTDGDSETGAARNYTLLSSGQYTGTTTVTVNAIDDAHTNNCVIDNMTALMWNAQNTPQSYGAGSEGLLFDDTAGSGEDIFAYCDAANTASLAGHNDWRVPNVFEMQTILNFEATDALPDSTYFTCSSSLPYHTSTSRPNAPTTHSITVAMAGGNTQLTSKTTQRGFLLLVRSAVNERY